MPEPDVVVLDPDVKMGQIHAERFYFVAEILSPNDKPRNLKLKRAYYQAHEPCHGVIFVRQDRISAELLMRDAGTWRSETMAQPTI